MPQRVSVISTKLEYVFTTQRFHDILWWLHRVWVLADVDPRRHNHRPDMEYLRQIYWDRIEGPQQFPSFCLFQVVQVGEPDRDRPLVVTCDFFSPRAQGILFEQLEYSLRREYHLDREDERPHAHPLHP